MTDIEPDPEPTKMGYEPVEPSPLEGAQTSTSDDAGNEPTSEATSEPTSEAPMDPNETTGGAVDADEITELDEPVLPIEIRIIQSVEERMKEAPFFNAYNDQDLLSLIHNLLAKSKVSEHIIHGKAMAYFDMIKEYHGKRQQPFKLPAHVLLHVRGDRPDYSDTAAVVANMNIKKAFLAKENDLNTQYLPIPERIGVLQPWTPKQSADVAISSDGTQRVRVLARDQVELDVIGYFKRRLTEPNAMSAYKTLEFAAPFSEKFEAYMKAVDQHFDVNGFVKQLNELTDLETLEKMLYEYDGVSIDDLTTVQQKVILFRLMRLADLEKPHVMESSSSSAFKPSKRSKEIQHPMHESAQAAQRAFQSLEPSWDDILKAAEDFQNLLSDARKTYEKPETKWFASPRSLFEAIRDNQITLNDAVQTMKTIVLKKDIEADFVFLKELVHALKSGVPGADSNAERNVAFGAQLRKSLRDDREPILRRYEVKLRSGKGKRTYFLDEALTDDAVVDEQAAPMDYVDVDDRMIDEDAGLDDTGVGVGIGVGDAENEILDVDLASIDASIREHVLQLARCFIALRDASQLPLDLPSMVEMYQQHLRGTSQFTKIRGAFGDYMSDQDILYVLSGGEITHEDIREPLETLLKSVRATFKQEIVRGFRLGLTWWILQLQQQYAAGQLTSLDPLSAGCKPMWALNGPPMSDFSSKRGALVFIMCAARYLWPTAAPAAFGRRFLSDTLNLSDETIADHVVKTAQEFFPEQLAYVRDAWNTRLKEEERAKKAPMNPYIAQMIKLKDLSSEHIRAYNKALLYLPSILLSTFKDPAKLLLPLRNTCCVQELTTTFKAYSDIRAIHPDAAKNPLWRRHVYFGNHFRAQVDARKGLAVIGAPPEADAVASAKPPALPQVQFGSRLKSAAVIRQDDLDAPPSPSVLSDYKDVLASLRIQPVKLEATRNDLLGLIRKMTPKKDDEQLSRLQDALGRLDEPLALELLQTLGRNLQKHAQTARDAIVGDIRRALGVLGSTRASIKVRMLRRTAAVEREQQVTLRDILGVLLCSSILLPAVRVGGNLAFMQDTGDAFQLYETDLRTIIADGVREVGRCIEERTLPSQETMFEYITKMRESLKQDKINKYERMTASERDDAAIAKKFGLNDVAGDTEQTSEETAIGENANPFEDVLDRDNIMVFYNADGNGDNRHFDAVDDDH